jgi:hypothetical protein
VTTPIVANCVGYHGDDMARPTKELQSFDALTCKLLTVSKSTVDARHAEHKARAAENPKKRRPKPKS